LAQANEAKQALEKTHPEVTCELVVLKTTGDDFSMGTLHLGTVHQKRSVSPGGLSPSSVSQSGASPLKGLFVKEIEEALLEGRIELAVHSVKDLQTDLPKGLTLAAILPRKEPRDALVAADGKGLKELPAQTAVGASSLRRQAQLLRMRRDLKLLPIRGNVDTRLRKLDAGDYGALILAACGLIRLGLQKRITEILDLDRMIPAPGQGALGIEIRENREEIASIICAVNHPDSQWEVTAERALLKALGGGCNVPVGALARVQDGALTLVGTVLSPDGLKAVRKEVKGPKQAAEKLGKELASHLRAAGADRMLYGQWGKERLTQIKTG
jgi:hydroxymethylbilane synthase